MHGLDQTARLRVVLTDDGLADLAQPQRPQGLACLPARTDGAAHLGDLELCHRYADPSRAADAASASASRRARSMPAGATSSIDRPRRAAASPCTGWTIVPPISGTRKKPLRASSTPLAIAAGTSLALP